MDTWWGKRMAKEDSAVVDRESLDNAFLFMSALSCKSSCLASPGDKEMERFTSAKAKCNLIVPLSLRFTIAITLLVLLSVSFLSCFKTSIVLMAKRKQFHVDPSGQFLQHPEIVEFPVSEKLVETQPVSENVVESKKKLRSDQVQFTETEIDRLSELTPSMYPTPSPLPPTSAPTMGPTTWSPNPRLAIFVMTGRANFEARKAIRETWAKNRTNVLFVVGKKWCGVPTALLSNFYPCALDPSAVNPDTTAEELSKQLLTFENSQQELNSRLLKENEKYKDILSLDMIDTYGNLAEKTKKTIEWAATNRPYSWMFKVDDDAVVNVDEVEAFLAKQDTRSLRLIGSFEHKSVVLRTSKWAELRFNETMYPVYPQGSTGYIFSGALVLKVASASKTLELYRNEDASIGIWLRQLGLKNGTVTLDEHHRLHKEWLYNIHNCLGEHRFSRKFTFSHDLKPDDIRKCYKHLVAVEKSWIEKRRRARRQESVKADDLRRQFGGKIGREGLAPASDEQFLLSQHAKRNQRERSEDLSRARSEEHIIVDGDGTREEVVKKVITLRNKASYQKDVKPSEGQIN